MRRIANGTQAASMPAPAAASGTPGFGVAANPLTGVQGTIIGPDEWNILQEEVVAVLAAAGLALDNTGAKLTQLRDAIRMQAPTSRNLILNPLFTRNCRNKTGSITLAAGAYGFDMWKAGAAGCSFTVSGGVATITAGSLKQIIEDPATNFGQAALGACVFSQGGTAPVAINGAAAATGIQTITHTSGAVTLEFGTGTISAPLFETGSSPTAFQARPDAVESALCKRWVRTSFLPGVTPAAGNPTGFTGAGGGTGVLFNQNAYSSVIYGSAAILFENPMAASPTVTTYNPNTASYGSYPSDAADVYNPSGAGHIGLNVFSSKTSILFQMNAGLVAQDQYGVHYFATCEP